MPVNIRTLGRRPAEFTYEGSVSLGLRLTFGETRQTARVSAEALRRLLDHFTDMPGPVAIGASRDKPPLGSLGAWWIAHQSRRQLASYLAAVLVEEGYAQKSGDQLIFPRNMD